MLDKIAQDIRSTVEALSPVLVDGMELLIDLLPADTHVLICDPELVRGRAVDLVKTSEEFLRVPGSRSRWRRGADRPGCIGVPAAGRGSRRCTRPRHGVGGCCRCSVLVRLRPTVGSSIPSVPRMGRSSISRHGSEGPCGVADRAGSSRRDLSWRHRGGRQRHHYGSVTAGAVVMAEGRGTADRIAEVLSEHAVPVRSLSALDEPPVMGLATVVTGQLSRVRGR